MSKDNTLDWANSILSSHIDNKTFGSVTFSMQNGVIGSVKSEVNQKPPIDVGYKKP